jgi:ParB family transcriptional regulator, chromosome partitioning protein
MIVATQKKGLGKGLGALFSNDESSENLDTSGVIELDINKIEPSLNQPRKYFEEDSLIELSNSIKQFGIIQPILVKVEGDFYSIIAGERRFRAARLANLSTIPAIIKDYNEVEILQVALIENIQRMDLNPIEEAVCFKKLIDEYFFTQEDIGLKVGKSRAIISMSISLLSLDTRVQDFIIEAKLNRNHGRILLSVTDDDDQFMLANEIVDNNIPAIVAEKLVSDFLQQKKSEDIKTPSLQKNDNKYSYLENDLKSILGTKVSIKDGKNKGKIEIEYYSEDDLDRLLTTLKKIGG